MGQIKSGIFPHDTVAIHSKEPQSTKLCDTDQVINDHVTNEKMLYFKLSSSARPMASKRDWTMASDERLLSEKSHKLLIMWSHKVTWQIKKIYI